MSRRQLMVEVPANIFGPSVSYLGEHLARYLGRDKIRGTVWLNLGVVDSDDPQLMSQLADWPAFRQRLREQLAVTVHDFRLDAVPAD